MARELKGPTMNSEILLVTICMVLTASTVAHCGMVDLRPDEKGDRSAVHQNGKVSYLPAKRVDLHEPGAGGGICRYIRRAKNGDLYIMGTGLSGVLRSTDGGHSWTSAPFKIEKMEFLSAFAILRDDTFLIAFMPGGLKDMGIAQSKDYGRTWQTGMAGLELSPQKHVTGYNGDLLELKDGTLLLTVEMRAGMDVFHDASGKELPMELKGFFTYVVRSRDGGKTWGEKSMLARYSGEAHLLELPSGKLMACYRKQRNHRIPGDPPTGMELKLKHGYQPQFYSEEKKGENRERTNRIKNMFVSESSDDGVTWVNERQASGFLQCSGDLTLLTDGTLVLAFDHRYPDDIANDGMRALVSYDLGKTWEKESYIISQGTSVMDTAVSYPSSIATEDGGLITVCANHVGGKSARLEAVHWRPLAK
jgi:hypothetical protein